MRGVRDPGNMAFFSWHNGRLFFFSFGPGRWYCEMFAGYWELVMSYSTGVAWSIVESGTVDMSSGRSLNECLYLILRVCRW
jgi:hypothetical protein